MTPIARLTLLSLLAGLAVVAASCADGPGNPTATEPAAPPASPTTPPTAESSEAPAAQDVRAARTRFNDAIAARDLDTIRALHAPEYHLITGRSAQFHGTDAHLALWEQSFAQDPPDLYVRTPREVRVNEAWGLAEELGDWRGTYSVNGAEAGERAEAWGSYAAKWQRSTNGQWLLQSEVFTTMGCEGPAAGCAEPDPI